MEELESAAEKGLAPATTVQAEFSTDPRHSTCQANFKDLSFTGAKETFFTSNAFSLSGHEWKIDLKFERAFFFFRFWKGNGWRMGMKDMLDNAWERCLCLPKRAWRFLKGIPHERKLNCEIYWGWLGNAYTMLVALGVYMIYGCCSAEAEMELLFGAKVIRWGRCLFLLWFIPMALITCLLCVVLLIILALPLLPCAVLAAIFLSVSFILWLPEGLFCAVCYALTFPFWYTVPVMSCTLVLLSAGPVKVKCAATLRSQRWTFSSRSKEKRDVLEQNKELEIEDFAPVACLESRKSYSDEWTTTIEITIKTEAKN